MVLINYYSLFKFRTFHSTESALLKVLNDICMVTDQGDSIVLVLLDLTAAFDMIDHNIVIAQLKSYVGLTGTVLGWFISYLKDRRISVRLRTHMSSAANLPWGVPQGSIRPPTLFSLYMLPWGSIFRKHCLISLLH